MDLSQIEAAKATLVINEIPDSYHDIAVTSSATAVELDASLGLGGKRVQFLAIGDDITYLGGDHTTAPVAAQLTVALTGDDDTEVPSGTGYHIGSVLYETDDAATIVAGEATVTMTAVETGADGNADDETTITIDTPIAGLDDDGTVTATETSGVDGDLLAAGQGPVLAEDAFSPNYFVNSAPAGQVMTVVAPGNATLRVLYRGD